MSKLSNSNSDTKDQPPGTPRWVKVCGIIGIVLVLLLVIKMFIGGGDHGPGRHMPDGDPAGQIEHQAPGDHTPPNDHRPQGGGH